MSTRDFENDREQREWDAQERALHAERAGLASGGSSAVAQYRLVARALRTPALDGIPSDFAARTAARAEREARLASDDVEAWLERGLLALLLLVGTAALLLYRDELLVRFTFSLPERAGLGIQTVLSWSLAIAACIGLSSVLARARQL